MKNEIESHPDLFGKLCLDYYLTGNEPEKTFYELCSQKKDANRNKVSDMTVQIPDYPISFYVDSKLRQIEQDILSTYAVGTILDIGCGCSRVHTFLEQQQKKPQSRQKVKVIGIDNSPSMLHISQAKGATVYPRNILTQSINDLPADTYLLMGNGWGMPGKPEQLKKVLRKIHHASPPHASVIGESNDPTKSTIEADQICNRLNIHDGLYIGSRKWRFGASINGDINNGKPSNWTLYEPDFLQKVAQECGWRLKEQVAEKGSPYAAYFVILQKG